MFNEATAAAPAPVETREEITFSATGGEYFRIWIVNLLLTIVTLGIYSAWAKVRRNQYFYSSTRLAGSSFEYHGRPMAILKGRLIALALFAAYNFAFTISPGTGIIMMLVMLAVMPYLMWKSLQFKLYNASYRGIRFGFDGSLGEAYAHFLLLPLLFGTGLLAPLAHHRIKRFQHTESRYGTAHFRFDARVVQFYKAYGVLLILLIAGMALVGFMLSRLDSGDGRLMVFLPVSFYLVLLILLPVFGAMLQNIIWNHTGLRAHGFRCEMKWGALLWIYVTNLFGIIFTLGLYTPFARVRSMRYRLEAMAMIVEGNLDDFVAAEGEQIAATGEGAADFMDLDLAL